jgi:hypothetical protein
MKHFITVCVCLLLVIGLNAQSLELPTDRSGYVSFFSQRLNLNESQIAKMGAIYDNRVKNLASIESLKSDPAKYKMKLNAIYEGTDGSVRMLLSKNQKKLYDAYKRERRQYRYERTKNLQAAGANADAVNASLAEGDF